MLQRQPGSQKRPAGGKLGAARDPFADRKPDFLFDALRNRAGNHLIDIERVVRELEPRRRHRLRDA